MLSKSKLTANRNNSQLSTGPRSLTGKTVVARNACKHNLSSVNITIAGEDLEDFHALLRETTFDLSPLSTIENALVQQIAYAEWKLLRIARWETDLIDATLAGRIAACQTLFGKSPDESLARLHRYESQVRRAWHAALREFVSSRRPPPQPLSVSPWSRNPLLTC